MPLSVGSSVGYHPGLVPLIAVLITCHNRRESTLRAIAALQRSAYGLALLKFYITDDGSTDGTTAALEQALSNAVILPGDGSLFWAGGMAKADLCSEGSQYDYLLWLNDDTIVDVDAISSLLGTSHANPRAIVVGCIRDPNTQQPHYGVLRRNGRHPARLKGLPASEQVQEGDTFEGNLVLIPRSVRELVGAIDGEYPHAYADCDYGYRAQRLGVKILQAPHTLAVCPANDSVQLVRGPRNTLRALESPKGLPWKAEKRFLQRHGGWEWPAYLVFGYTKRLLQGTFIGTRIR